MSFCLSLPAPLYRCVYMCMLCSPLFLPATLYPSCSGQTPAVCPRWHILSATDQWEQHNMAVAEDNKTGRALGKRRAMKMLQASSDSSRWPPQAGCLRAGGCSGARAAAHGAGRAHGRRRKRRGIPVSGRRGSGVRLGQGTSRRVLTPQAASSPGRCMASGNTAKWPHHISTLTPPGTSPPTRPNPPTQPPTSP